MTLEWTALAIERAHEAAEYIARDKPESAERWLQGLFQSVERLRRFPRSGRVVPEFGRPDVREVVHGKYRVVYRLLPPRVIVVTVRHGRRQLDRNEVESNR